MVKVQGRSSFIDRAHIQDDVLELYARGRIKDERELQRIEEHLLICVHCQDRLHTEDWRSTRRAARYSASPGLLLMRQKTVKLSSTCTTRAPATI